MEGRALPVNLADRSRAELASMLPELLLAGHLIDRAGMPHLIGAFGADTMRDIAIDEWKGASPVYSKRMQRALGFEGDTVETIFKNIQLDIGAPPQFLDFRFAITDLQHGEFWLDHCGALMDVEPMGDDYVFAMCHEIEDPTFDATATASNPRARVRPIHRPPRVPADRSPHCAWTVTIDEANAELPVPEEAKAIAGTQAAQLVLDPVDPVDEGRGDYAGPLLSDLRFEDFSASALRRMTAEVCLQGHLLALSFLRATSERTEVDEARSLLRHQFTGVAGVAAARAARHLSLGHDLAAAAEVLAWSPGLMPSAYTGCAVELTDRLLVRIDRRAPAFVDGAWPTLIEADHLEPLDAIVLAVDPRLHCVVLSDGDDELVVEVVRGAVERAKDDDVRLTEFSTGSDFTFVERGTPVEIRPAR
jgi:hypothetical protein